MISRILLPILLMIVLSDGYIWMRYLRGRVALRKSLMWFVPGFLMALFTVFIAFQKDFAPADSTLFNVYLFFLGFIVVAKMLFGISSAVGWGLQRLLNIRRNYGNAVGLVVVALVWYVLLYGVFVGFKRLEVRHVVYTSRDLPAAFDGYRIVHFSDAHVGTYGRGYSRQLARAVDSINVEYPDMVVFTGDLQNMQPGEVLPHEQTLARLNARDGVYSVLGNHDYAQYIHADEAVKTANVRYIRESQRRMGWTLLDNAHRVIRRGADSIVIAGMENDGDGRHFPQKGDIARTLHGVSDSSFVVMLQHDPTSWRRKILPQSGAQLTLSGHTHAMQFCLFGWSPSSLIYSEWGGMFYEGNRAINVSTGLGGFIPFRFGVPGEIVVITLKREN